MLMDKVSFFTYAQEAALPIPRTFIVESMAEVEQAANELTFPCILKPPLRTSAWEKHVRAKVFKISSSDKSGSREQTPSFIPVIVISMLTRSRL
jgi:predicted ATP-grasp superfamily ATP-dependent carboligase